MPPNPARKKKKGDYEALNAPLMQIPGMKVDAVRALLNAGVREIYELSGRAPEVLFDESKAKDPELNEVLLPYFRMAVYYAESDAPDNALMTPHAWDS